MNWLDKAINWVSPESGLRRARARAVREVVLSYEGVRSARRQGGWITTGASGNAEIGPASAKLRENARDLYRNNAIAKKIVRRRSKRVVGYGIMPQADTGTAAINQIIDTYWKQWVPQCASDRRFNFYALQQLIVETEFVCGEVLIRLWGRKEEDGLPVPFQLQVLEPDYLDMGKTQTLDNGAGYIIHGVQFDPIGRITGYWLFGQHPGDVTQTSARGVGPSRFVPADLVIHHCQPERPGDVRAVSRFAPIIAKLRDLDETADAMILRKKIEACLVGMVTQAEGVEGRTLGAIAVDANGNRVEEMQPGMLMYGEPGAGVEFFSPTASGDYSATKKTELREVAAGVDLPYVVIGEDLSDVNYSSFRGGAIDERDGVEQYRWNWFIPQVLDPIWRRFVDALYMMGVIPEQNYGVKWCPPPFDLLDREAEAKADQLELQLGKRTWPQLVGDQGYDPEKQIADITAWKSRLEAAGVTFGQQAAPQPQPQQKQQGGGEDDENDQATESED